MEVGIMYRVIEKLCLEQLPRVLDHCLLSSFFLLSTTSFNNRPFRSSASLYLLTQTSQLLTPSPKLFSHSTSSLKTRATSADMFNAYETFCFLTYSLFKPHR